MANNTTEINDTIRDKSSTTEINASVRREIGGLTEVNPNVKAYGIDIPRGTLLAEKYVIDGPLSTNSGEANLYICSYRKKQYVAKVYRRQSAIKEDVILALEDIKSPYVARLYATGIWNGCPFEILPYYKFGSLEGKTFKFEQLRKYIIPALNEGLKALHDKDVIHKDLKPSNIMLCDDEKSVAIIDFGISSIREGGNTVVVTKTGMTPEYSAPETFRGLYLQESDYYSLGVTLYELYTGHTPYSGSNKESIEKYISIQKIPFPDAFPPELRRLITGLTYNDITNRKDKSNPNRRWTYEEVDSWCKGKQLALPGGEGGEHEVDIVTSMPMFRFQYKAYRDVGELANAMGLDWKNGKKRLYRSLLADHFRTFDQEIASACMDAEEAVRKDPTRADIEFFCVLYKMYPLLRSFHWNDYHFESMLELGNTILDGLRKNSTEVYSMVNTFFSHHLFSERERIVSVENPTRINQISAIETKYSLAQRNSDERLQLEQAYIIGYLYSESQQLVIPNGSFSTIEELTEYSKSLLGKSPEAIDDLSKQLIISSKKVKYKQSKEYTNGPVEVATPQFSAWLYVQGKSSALDY